MTGKDAGDKTTTELIGFGDQTMTTLDQILDVVMELPEDQQDMLVDIVQHRRIEARRKDIAKAASESLALFHSGQLKPQPVEAIIEKLRYGLPE